MKKVIEEEAVSEVVGTILVLAITVVLFSAVFVYVQQFPLATTSKQITVVQQLSYNVNTHTLFENLTDKSGSILLRNDTYFVVLIDNHEYSTNLANLRVKSPYENSSSLFEPGDTITWNSSYVGATVRENSSINSMLLYRPSNQVLWQSINNVSSGLSISVFYVNPSPIKANGTFTIFVQINTFDPNGTTAYLNLTSLYGMAYNKSMNVYSLSENELNFYFEGIAPSSIPSYSMAKLYVSCDDISVNSEINLS